ncbi:MAG: CaiB/BaiF CoA transferase family protein [Candidatus Binatia bacterium]
MQERRPPLSGIKVLDFTHQAAGPWCTTLLGDMGADVVKVEKPGRGDGIRYAGSIPPEVGSLNFWGLNRNKRGLGVDLRNPHGRDLLERLALQSDVVVENFRPGVMERHGLGYDDLRARNPRLVYCSITAFGATGPLSQKPGMDLILQATGGLMGHTGEIDGPPVKAAPPAADITSGVYAAYGILGALYERERSGLGQKVELAMLDAVVSLFADVASNVLTNGTIYGKYGSGHPDLCPYQAFRAKDGYFIVACLTNAFWKRLAVAIGREDLLTHPHFETNKARVEHRKEVVETLEAIFVTRDVDHWIRLIEENDIPTCRVNRLDEILAHPQIGANDAVAEVPHPVLGAIRTLAPTVKLRATPSEVRNGAPRLCADTRSVLHDAGLAAEEIEGLFATGAIGE